MSALQLLKSWLDAGLAFFYPEVCQICESERAGPAQGYLGAKCREQIVWLQRPFCERCGRPFEGNLTQAFECAECRENKRYFVSARSAVAASGVVLEVIHRYKYQRALWFEPFLAELMIQQAEPVLKAGSWDAIVPVPLHPLKEREREFNQAERLAAHLGKRLGIPIQKHLLKRIKPTPTQTFLNKAARQANMQGAFRMNSPLNCQSVILIDDVFTTGATTNACARVLAEAGAGPICVWTVARGI